MNAHEHDVRLEEETLRRIATTVLRNERNVTVVIDPSAKTASTDLQGNITVTPQLIPKDLLQYPAIVRRLMDGQVLHEVSHERWTFAIRQPYQAYRQTDNLASMTGNMVEDYRINHQLRSLYRFDDYSGRLQFLLDIVGRTWEHDLRERLRGGGSKPAEVWWECIALTKLYERDVADIVQELAGRLGKPDEVLADTAAIYALMDTYRSAKTGRRAVELLWRIDRLFRKHLTSLSPKRIPNVAEGERRFERSDPATVRKARAMEGLPDDEGEDEAKAASTADKEGEPADGEGAGDEGEEPSDGDGQPQQDDGDEKDDLRAWYEPDASEVYGQEREEGLAFARGRGDGRLIPAVPAEPEAYQRLVREVAPQVSALLRMLERIKVPQLLRSDWQRHGRMMPHMLHHAFIQSRHRVVDDVYTSLSTRYDNEKVAIVLVVDLSGSMPLETARRVLAIIAEVCGRWCADQDFGILTFGSDVMRIKTLTERYYTTRYRIGGLANLCMGATELSPALEDAALMLRGATPDRKRYCVVVTDWEVGEKQSLPKQIEAMEAEGITVLGIDLRNQTLGRQYLTQADRGVGVVDADELPGAFFTLYRQVALQSPLQRRRRASA